MGVCETTGIITIARIIANPAFMIGGIVLCPIIGALMNKPAALNEIRRKISSWAALYVTKSNNSFLPIVRVFRQELNQLLCQPPGAGRGAASN